MLNKYKMEQQKSSFVLFDVLAKKCQQGAPDITIEECKELIENARKLDREGFEYMFVLIKTYSNMEKQGDDIPYKGQKINENKQTDRVCDIKFDIRNFNPMLRKILLEFTRLHLEKMSDERKRLN
jgi:hypothetical protein